MASSEAEEQTPNTDYSLLKISSLGISFALFIWSDPLIQDSSIPAKHYSDITLNIKACEHFE